VNVDVKVDAKVVEKPVEKTEEKKIESKNPKEKKEEKKEKKQEVEMTVEEKKVVEKKEEKTEQPKETSDEPVYVMTNNQFDFGATEPIVYNRENVCKFWSQLQDLGDCKYHPINKLLISFDNPVKGALVIGLYDQETRVFQDINEMDMDVLIWIRASNLFTLTASTSSVVRAIKKFKELMNLTD
jgi:hypothetical protein